MIDEAGNYAQIDYHIHVVWPKPKEEKEEKIQKSKKKKEKISASLEGEKKKIKKKLSRNMKNGLDLSKEISKINNGTKNILSILLISHFVFQKN